MWSPSPSDGQGLFITGSCQLIIACILGDNTQLKTACGHTAPVSELLEDGQGLRVTGLRLLVIALILSEHGQLMEGTGGAR